MLDISITLAKLVSVPTLWASYYYPYFQTWKQKFREFNSLTEGHTASKHLNPKLTPKCMLFPFPFHLSFMHACDDTSVNFLEAFLTPWGSLPNFGLVTCWVIEEWQLSLSSSIQYTCLMAERQLWGPFPPDLIIVFLLPRCLHQLWSTSRNKALMCGSCRQSRQWRSIMPWLPKVWGWEGSSIPPADGALRE